jgi:hypothetical protein
MPITQVIIKIKTFFGFIRKEGFSSAVASFGSYVVHWFPVS